jgi:putative endonuclease
MRDYYVYILASFSRALYVGVTNDLERRVFQHREPNSSKFTGRYRISRLVYVETFADPREAIAREKQLKNWRREKKVALIEESNPGWRDLSDGWFR